MEEPEKKAKREQLRPSASSSAGTSRGIVGNRCNVFYSSYLEAASRNCPDRGLRAGAGRPRSCTADRPYFNVHRSDPLRPRHFRRSGGTLHRGIRRRFKPICLNVSTPGTERDRLGSAEIRHMHYGVVVTAVNVDYGPPFLLLRLLLSLSCFHLKFQLPLRRRFDRRSFFRLHFSIHLGSRSGRLCHPRKLRSRTITEGTLLRERHQIRGYRHPPLI